MQLLVVFFSIEQTGGSANVQHDFEQVVESQLYDDPVDRLLGFNRSAADSAPHCFWVAKAGVEAARIIAQSKSLI